jgi:hypothetical protein
VKISCKEDVHVCRTNFAKKMEQNLHETTSWWKTYGKRLFSEDLEVRDVARGRGWTRGPPMNMLWCLILMASPKTLCTIRLLVMMQTTHPSQGHR